MSRTVFALGLVLALSGGLTVHAQEAAPGAAPVDAVAPTPAATASDPLGESLTPADLIGRRGGQTTNVNVTNLQTLTATSAGNSVNAQTLDTGDVTFEAGALNGFSGVGNFVVNTGANANVLGSVSVTIVNAPAP